MGDSSYKNRRPLWIVAFSLQLLSENKEHIERNIQHLGILISLIWQESGSEKPLGGIFSKFSHFSKEFKESFLYRGKFFGKSFLYKGNILRLFFLYKGKCCIFAPRLT